ncbi:MAG: alpha/beta hydrolase [Actinomycetota bacterium]
MTITTNPDTRRSTADSADNDAERRGPLVRVIAGSLVTGIVIAGGLTLGVLSGAREHVVTGSALLGFAIGWTMLAVLSTRLTSQPQRWAFVPAAVMAVTGAGLITTAPSDGALAAAAWVWSPIAIVLAAWSVRQVRRSLQSKARFWLVYPVLGALTVAAIGGGYQAARQRMDRNAFPMPGTSYDIGGRTLHLNCTGAGSPTVVVQSGLGETSPAWIRVRTAVGETSRVCAYDRAGQGWSGDAPHAPDGLDVAADLHALLHVAGEAGPYVLVGHSTGGTYALTYAAQYPSDVAGMVLLDSSSPYQFTALPKYKSQYAMSRSLYGVLPSLTRIGVGQLLPTTFFSALPSPEAEQVQAFARSPRGARNSRDEQSQLRAAFEQAQALTTLGAKPLVVVSSSVEMSTTPGWSAAQDQLAALSSNTSHRVAHGTHVAVVDDQLTARTSAEAIRDVVVAVRTDSAVRTG